LTPPPEALWEWLLQLRQAYPQARVALCLEQPAVHLIAFLQAYEWISLCPVNPISLQKFREAFVTSRAKDDAKDAHYLAELLLTHHDQLKIWAPEDSATAGIQQWVFHRRAVIDERTGLTNRLISLLKQYFPQALDLCGQDLWRPLATRFLLKWPSLQAVQKAKPATAASASVEVTSGALRLHSSQVASSNRSCCFSWSAGISKFGSRRWIIVQKAFSVVGICRRFSSKSSRAFWRIPIQFNQGKVVYE
jgi:hypothetical protein